MHKKGFCTQDHDLAGETQLLACSIPYLTLHSMQNTYSYVHVHNTYWKQANLIISTGRFFYIHVLYVLTGTAFYLSLDINFIWTAPRAVCVLRANVKQAHKSKVVLQTLFSKFSLPAMPFSNKAEGDYTAKSYLSCIPFTCSFSFM